MSLKCDIPLIADIKRSSFEDGPGIRTVVFFKGCPLHCIFCHNPEMIDRRAEIAFYAGNCINCEECAAVCPEKAVDMKAAGRIYRDRCNLCGECVKVCPGEGLRLIGSYYPVDELAEILLRDRPFYRHSGGGVTISGGECTLHPEYLESLLKLLKTENIHVVLETCGYFDYQNFKEKILPHIDLVYYDIKIADPADHIKYTGRSNTKIIDNLYRLLRESHVKIHPRIPLVPSVTATRENLSAIVNLVCDAGAESISLLPYNPMGLEAAKCLGKPVPVLPKTFMEPDEEKRIFELFERILEEKHKALRRVS